MRKVVIFLLIILYSSSAFCDQKSTYLHDLENPRYRFKMLKKENKIKDYLHYDFSTLFVPKSKFLGFIGLDYKRMRIYYHSVAKDQNNDSAYQVHGSSIVGNNLCIFQGEIKIIQVREYKNMHLGVDLIFKDAGIKSQGILIAEYTFKENIEQKYSGVFKGIMTLQWYVDRYGLLNYDNISAYADGYSNNQYVGYWEQYNKMLKKVANWGEYRIPYSGDLDIGAGRFGVNPKYSQNGWEDYIDW